MQELTESENVFNRNSQDLLLALAAPNREIPAGYAIMTSWRDGFRNS